MTLPQPVRLATALVEAGVPIVVAGGTAAWLTASDEAPLPSDLDVLLPPTDDAVAGMVAALALVNGRSVTRCPRHGEELVEFEPWQLMTDLGPLDVFALQRPLRLTRAVQLGAGMEVFVHGEAAAGADLVVSAPQPRSDG
ncbi:MAG: hypothetical protein ACT4QG_16675 [Sporichthyaceae bacterium]